jgi:hypothetical protein
MRTAKREKCSERYTSSNKVLRAERFKTESILAQDVSDYGVQWLVYVLSAGAASAALHMAAAAKDLSRLGRPSTIDFVLTESDKLLLETCECLISLRDYCKRGDSTDPEQLKSRLDSAVDSLRSMPDSSILRRLELIQRSAQ